MTRKTCISLIALVLCMVTTGCVAPKVVRHYDGQKRPITEIAILYHNTESGLKIFDVDGESVLGRFTTWNPDGWEELHLLPGEHTLSGGLYLGSRYAIFYENYYFAPGKRYKMVYELIDDQRARFRLVEAK